MWARYVECIVSFFYLIILYKSTASSTFVVMAGLCFVFIIFFSLLSFFKIFSKLHLLNFLSGAVLLLIAYQYPTLPLPFVYQGCLILGLIYLMLSLIPSRCLNSPKSWESYLKPYKKKKQKN